MPIVRVPNDDDEVIRISNSTPFGLSSGVCTNRLDRITRFIEGLNVGTVNIWEVPGYRIEMSPFGGIKDSGNGVKEGVIEAMKFFTNVKTWSLPGQVCGARMMNPGTFVIVNLLGGVALLLGACAWCAPGSCGPGATA